MMPKIVLEVQAPRNVPEGKHTGAIDHIEVSERKPTVEYLDVHLTCDGTDVVLKAGYPTSLNPTTLLGKLLGRFGAKVEPKAKVDVGSVLAAGRKVQYVTVDDKSERGTFSRVARESLRPLEGGK